MGLDDFTGGSPSRGGGGGGRGRRTTKMDFSRPYVRIIRRLDEQVTADVGAVRIIKPEDDLEEDHEVLCQFQNRLDWSNFRSRVEKEFDLDADKVLENNPERIPDLKSELPRPEPRVPTRECVVCGKDLRPDRKPFTELRLARDGQANMGADRVVVCQHHTVEELVNANADN